MPATFGHTNTQERTRLQSFVIVFFLYFSAGAGAQYLFYNLHTGPTVFWLPAGIGLGFILTWGMEQWIPIAVAQVAIPLVSTSRPGVEFIFVNAVAYSAQALLGAYFLNKMNFDGMMSKMRDALLLVGASFIISAVAPCAVIAVAYFLNPTHASFWTSWSRLWVGGIFGTLLATPFITSWFPSSWDDFAQLKWKEASAAFAAIALTTYLLFWTNFLGAYAFIMIYVFLAVFFWVGIRLQPRLMMFALLFAAAFGTAGTIIAHPTAGALNTQLFSDQLFFILVIPIFLIMSVLVTERRVATQALEQEKRDLAQALARLSEQDRSKNEFISIFAHELRNPLAPIASTLEYLRLNERNEDNLRAVEVADQQVRIVRRLLDDLLDVARMTQKKFNLQKEVVPLETIIQPAVAAVRAFFETRGHSFWFSLPEEETFVNVDTARMTQAVMNLLFNAGKYTPPGGTIELTARKEGEMLVIAVKDNGIGISAETLPLIFEPFQQASRDSQVGTGLGLGLFIARQLIEMHGGTLTAMSEGINKGTTFTIRIPLAQKTQRFKPADPFAVTLPSRRLYILVVDDNQAAAQSLQKLLALRGHSVRIAHTGEAALKAIEGHPPEVVLLDIGLPDMNGHELAREIRRRGVKLALIALTGYGQEEDRAESERAGFDYHLTKPIGLAELESVFDSLPL